MPQSRRPTVCVKRSIRVLLRITKIKQTKSITELFYHFHFTLTDPELENWPMLKKNNFINVYNIIFFQNIKRIWTDWGSLFNPWN